MIGPVSEGAFERTGGNVDKLALTLGANGLGIAARFADLGVQEVTRVVVAEQILVEPKDPADQFFGVDLSFGYQLSPRQFLIAST